MDEDNNELDKITSPEDDINTLVNPSPTRMEFKVNRYATYKTLATGSINIALLTNNVHLIKIIANQGPEDNHYYYPNMVLISTSIVLQFVLKCMCIIVGTSKVNLDTKEKSKDVKRINGINKSITIISVVITFINIIVTSLVNSYHRSDHS